MNRRSNRAVWLLLLVLAAGAVAYVPGLSAPFIFDDLGAIPANPHIRHLWPLSRAWSAPDHTALAGRPVVSLSLALNFALDGLRVHGYHVFNLAIHLVSAVLLFALIRRTLHSPVFAGRYERSAPWIALAATAIWTLHPLHTETVIYVIQRTELLMALFYLLMLYCALRGFGSAHPGWWYAAAVAACALGMGCKEVMVSAPLVVLLYDRAFNSPSFRAALRARPGLYSGLAASWIVLGVLLAAGPRSDSVGFEHGITALDYLRTQAGVILWYLRLTFYPHPLAISYDDWPIVRAFSDAVIPGAVILVLLGATLWAWRRRPAAGFLGAWFFLILAPTSSFVPIVTEVAAERRMYLPLVAPVLLCVLAGHWLLRSTLRRAPRRARRVASVAVVAIAAVLAPRTFTRAQDYRSAVAIWQDTVAKRPQNAVAHVNLGNALFDEGQMAAALRHYHTALDIEPGDAEAHYNLANALVRLDRVSEALPHYEQALRLKPRYADAHYNLALALSRLERSEEEMEHYRAALRINPEHVGAGNNLGLALARQGQYEAALPYYRQALQSDPDATVVRRNLGDALLDLGRFDEAAAQYRRVLAVDPDNAGAHCNLGITLAVQNRPAEAIAELRTAVRLDPEQAGARHVLQELLARQSASGTD